MLIFLLGTAAALYCGDHGREIVIEGTQYTCNGEEVDESDYDSTDPDCSESAIFVDACLCPADYIGVECEERNEVHCAVLLEQPQYTDCPGGSDYNFDLKGYPECIYVDAAATLNIELYADCETFTDGEYIDESYLNYTDKSASEIYSEQPPFVYALNNGRLVSSVSLDSHSVIRFVNFNKLTDTTGRDEKALTDAQLLGNDLIIFEASLSEIPDFETAGRYYYEVYVDVDNKDGDMSTTTYRNVLDREGYDEPSRDTGLSTVAIVLIVLGVCIFVGLVIAMGFVYYRRKKLKLE